MKIQSVSDIITNSSSEVFIMPTTDAIDIDKKYNTYCIDYTIINKDFLTSNFWMIPDICEVLKYDIKQHFGKDLYYLNDTDRNNLIKAVTPLFLEFFGAEGEYSYVDIEDHFIECDDAYEDAHSVCIWSDYRH
ncbi:MAG: hypothetical protein [Wendovervirus sonii]|uniref:Uncharacterized protein n=1 Tax=phage Lak_Megaphage_Sonny TaxID=3109229 RepID=A0ABZ0Z3C8_9CAUD|nr:MAG: hypothetical protein [phage Lak_Megaphage_Sonny]